jgi:hypothetical protein
MKKFFELNLVREKITVQRKMQHIFLVLNTGCGVTGLLFVFLICNYFFVSGRIANQRKQLTAMATDITAMEKRYNLDALKTEWESYSSRLTHIEESVARRTSVTAMVREMSGLLPPDVCLIRLHVNEGVEKKVTIDIVSTGKTRSGLEAVNEVIDKTKKSVFLKNGATLESQQKSSMNGQEVDLFRLSIML